MDVIDPDEIPDVVVTGAYVCPHCGAHYSLPRTPHVSGYDRQSLKFRCHGLLVEILPETLDV